MPTIAQAQAEFLKAGGLDIGGLSKQDAPNLDPMQEILSQYISDFLNTASDYLKRTNSITTGNLDQSLGFKIVNLRDGYRIDFKALEYFKFVDKGVRGAGSSRKNSDSPYSFKSIYPSKDHVTAIEKWIILNRLTATARDTRKYKTNRERKAIPAAMARRNLAYVIARSIKRDGLYATGFWTDAFEKTFQNFGQEMSKALGKTITVNLELMKEELANFKGKGAGKGVKIV